MNADASKRTHTLLSYYDKFVCRGSLYRQLSQLFSSILNHSKVSEIVTEIESLSHIKKNTWINDQFLYYDGNVLAFTCKVTTIWNGTLFLRCISPSPPHMGHRDCINQKVCQTWSSLGNESVAAALSFLSLQLNKKHDHDRLIYCLGSGPHSEGLPWPRSSPWASSPEPVSLWAGPQAVAPHLRLNDKSILISIVIKSATITVIWFFRYTF